MQLRQAFKYVKKKGRCESFRYPQGVKLDQGNSRIFLPKLGWVRYRNSRDVLGVVKNATVSQSGSKWFVSIDAHCRTSAQHQQNLPVLRPCLQRQP